MWHATADRLDTDEVKADFRLLVEIAEHLCLLAEEASSRQGQIEHKGFPWFHHITSLFLLNQLHYLEDMISLVPNRTAELIARTMVEGYLKLTWVAEDGYPRAERWFSYVWLQEWKYAIRQEARGVNVEDDKGRLIEQIRSRATQHLTKSGKRALAEGAQLDPFKHVARDWTGHQAYSLAKTTHLTNLYAKLYDPLNDWVHWSPKGFIKSSDVGDHGVRYTFRSYYQSTACLVAGITSLLGCLKIWNTLFARDLDTAIKRIEADFEPFAPALDLQEGHSAA